MRVFLAAAALFLAAGASAAPKHNKRNLLGGPIAPHLFAYDLDDRGWSRYPYDPDYEYRNGSTYFIWAAGTRQFLEDERKADHVAGGLVSGFGRLGLDFRWSRFDRGTFRYSRRTDMLSMHGTADLSWNEDTTIGYGFGFATIQADESPMGVSTELMLEQRLGKPWTFQARWSPALMGDGRIWHDVSGGFNVNWNRAGLLLGYRGFLNPRRNADGPEVGLRLTF